MEDFTQADAGLTFELVVGEERWNPPSGEEFLRDLDEDAINRLKKAEATVVAGGEGEHQATLVFMPGSISLSFESPSSLYISALTRFAEEELEHRRPPRSWSIPTYVFVAGWISLVATFPWMLTRGVKASIFVVFAPFLFGLVLVLIGAVLRVQMPWIDLRADRDGFGWERFRGKLWRAALWLIPLVASVAFFVFGRSSGGKGGTEQSEVDAIYAGVSVSHKYWAQPAELSTGSRPYLVANWGALNPNEVHRYDPIGSQAVTIEQVWKRKGLNGTRLRIKGFVTSLETILNESEHDVKQFFGLGIKGELSRAVCVGSLPEGKRVKHGDYVSVVAIPVARGFHSVRGRQVRTTFLVCPEIKRLK